MLHSKTVRHLVRRISPFLVVSLIANTLATPLALTDTATKPSSAGSSVPTHPLTRMIGVPAVSKRRPLSGHQLAGQKPAVPNITLLDEVGRLNHEVTTQQVASWKRELKTSQPTAKRAAKLHVWLGEYELGRNEEPERAIWHFKQAQRIVRRTEPLFGLAAYDIATGLFYEGAYQEACDAFHRLLVPKTRLHGYSRQNCALWLKHASACAGYHAAHANMGIPEPPRLDPLCAAANLAVCLRELGLPYDKKTVLPTIRYTGEGSNAQDIAAAAKRLHVSARPFGADQAGLIAMPKPIIAHVEHDHFVAILDADRRGVSYLCSDCGTWPGGRVNLSWKQWKAMEADLYISVSKPGSLADRLFDALAKTKQSKSATVQLAANPAGSFHSQTIAQLMPLLQQITGHVILEVPLATATSCGSKPGSLHCAFFIFCWMDCPPSATPPGPPPFRGGDGTVPNPWFPGGPRVPVASVPADRERKDVPPVDRSSTHRKLGERIQIADARAVGPQAGDPVNVATGEEEYTPGPDLTVYNPVGPSVVWSRLYNSLRPVDVTYQCNDFGVGWSQSYNVGVLAAPGFGTIGASSSRYCAATAVQAGPNPNYVVFPNGSRVSFTAPSTPDVNTPHVSCTVQAGAPMLVDWNYDTASATTYFVVTFENGSKWILNGNYTLASGGQASLYNWFALKQIVDRNANAINFNYNTPPNGSMPWITSITDKNNVTLLTVNRATDGTGNITSIADRYNRSVYYHVGTYNTTNVPPGVAPSYQEVDQASQIVATGTTNPPVRFQYGYQNVSNLEGAEQVPFLHTISVPSPTGTGMSTATINYDPTTDFVSSLVDANGNTHAYTTVDQLHTKTTVTDPANHVAYSYPVGFDTNMSTTSVADGAGNLVAQFTYSDPSTPYSPSSVSRGSLSWSFTHDQFGHVLTSTSPRNTTTTYTYDYSQFALGRLTTVQQGIKTATSYTYYEPSGLLHTLVLPAPGGTGTVTTSQTYDSLGNPLTVTSPGNGTVTSITTTFNYTTDGAYSQAAAIGEPLTVTDNLGHTRHHRYDSRRNRVSVTDALGNEVDTSFNLADQPVVVTNPATGQSGTGHSQKQFVYLYVGGPMTAVQGYDESGTLVRQANYTYGAEGEPKTVTGWTEPVTYTYDAYYRVTGVTDGNNHTSTFSYNTAGYLSSVVYPGMDSVQCNTFDMDCTPKLRHSEEVVFFAKGATDEFEEAAIHERVQAAGSA